MAGMEHPGPLLRSRREALGIGMREFARSFGLSQATLGGYERGEHRIPYELLTKWGAALKVRVQLIVRPEDEEDVDPATLDNRRRGLVRLLLSRASLLSDSQVDVLAAALEGMTAGKRSGAVREGGE